MNKARIGVVGFLLGLSSFLSVCASDDAREAQGEWRLSNWTLGDSVRLELTHRDASSRWQWTDDQAIADLHGLTRDQLRSVRTTVAFTLERDPGVFFFEGSLAVGLGRGTYRFVANPSFATKLEALGYGPVGADELFGMAIRGISLAYAEEVKRLGLHEVAVRDLVRFRDHGMSLDFIRDLATAGHPGLTGDDVVTLRDHGIDGRYVARVQSAGFKELTVEQIVRLHDHGVD